MRKIYFSAVLFTLGAGAALAQSSSLPALKAPRAAKPGDYVMQLPHPYERPVSVNRADPFWTEDFTGGAIPDGWTNVDDMTPLGTPEVIFEWSDDPTAVEVASLGHPHIAMFNAASATNGYLWANSDRGLTAAPTSNHLTRLTTTAIDCSGQATVRLSFASVVGVFDNPAMDFVKVRVSTDLTNWTDFFPFPCLDTGSPVPPCERFSANPEMVELNISSVAANQPAVYIQWEWQGGWEYYWAIDDVQLSAVPDYSRVLVTTTASHVADSLEYARIPSGQLTTDFVLGGQVRNDGLSAQNNVVLTVTVNGPGGATFSSTQTATSIAPDETYLFEEIIALPGALAEGLYTVDYNVTSDEDAQEEDLTDDVDQRVFEVNDELYSLDGFGVIPPAELIETSLGSDSFEDAEDGLLLLTFYTLNAPTTVYGIEALITPGSTEGANMIMSVHSAETINLNDVTSSLAESDLISVSADNITSGSVVGTFSSPLDLEAGDYYVATQLLSNSGANHVRVRDDATVPQVTGASLIYIPNDQLYSNGNAIALRMMLDPTVSINEEELVNVSVYPNPTEGLVNIFMGETGTYNVEVFNVIGERVHTGNFTNNTVLDLSGNAQGVYMVHISNDKASSIQRITLK